MPKRFYRVLIVDDEPETCVYLREVLGSFGELTLVVDCVHRPDEVLKEVQSRDYDIIFLDHRLGPTTGLELLPQIRTAGYKKGVVVMSGFSDHDLSARARIAGANEYLSKNDFSLETLETLTRKVINGLTVGPDSTNPPLSFPPTSSTPPGSGVETLLTELIKVNRDYVQFTSENSQAIKENTQTTKRLASTMEIEIQGLRKDLNEGLSTMELNLKDLHKEGQKTKGEILQGVEDANKHVLIKVLDWISDHKAVSIAIAVAMIILILLAVLVSQTLNVKTVNEIRSPSPAATGAP